MEKIYPSNSFKNELCATTEESPVFMGENVGITSKSREKTVKIMFENFKIPAFASEQK